jgi:serine/threonine protein phosphatase PrpC
MNLCYYSIIIFYLIIIYMKFTIQSYSTKGVRDSNEDAMDHVDNLNDGNNLLNRLLYIGIFDGHGGGSISKILVDNDKIGIAKYFCNINSPLSNKLSNHKSFNQKIITLFERIQEKLKNYYIHSNTMGSTALISIIYPKNEKNDKYSLKVINLGDSRAVICTHYNIANQLSLDHKPHLYCEKNRIIQMGGSLEYSEGDDPRINGMSVSRSFGDLDNSYISQQPDIYDYSLTNEKFIIMGCDGVWDVLNNQDTVDFVLECISKLKMEKKNLTNLSKSSEYNIAQKLSKYAIEKGSKDNISVYILFFDDNL